MSADPPSMPIGTVTFLLTDVEGSTRAWSAELDGTAAAVIRHYHLLEESIAAHGGYRPVDRLADALGESGLEEALSDGGRATVAQRLYVAHSTVKTHLERIYAKLGISGRAALTTELTRHERMATPTGGESTR
jgi:hypothetical protein